MENASCFALLVVLVVPLSAMTASVPLGSSASLIDPSPHPPRFYDMNDSQVRNATIGHTVVISTNFTNTNREELGITFLIEVRDESGVTLYLAWQTANISPMSTRSAGVSWTSDKAGEYQIRVFVISNLTSPQALGTVETAQFVMLEPEEEEKVYSLKIDGKEYDIVYSLESGHITKISYAPSLSTIQLQLFVPKDSELVIKYPRELLYGTVACGAIVSPNASDIDAEVFVDTIPSANVKETGTHDSKILQIPLPAGTEVVEIVGACPI